MTFKVLHKLDIETGILSLDFSATGLRTLSLFLSVCVCVSK